jgi:hypothetical protein
MLYASINRRDVVLATAGMAVVAPTTSSASAQTTVAGPGMPDEPLGGQPPAGSAPSVKDFEYQIKYQRAFEAMLWSIPATSIYAFRRAFDSVGLKDNDIVAYSAGGTPKLEAVTANSTTPYISACTDLRKGPVVLELPAAAEASLFGQVEDAWQIPVAEVGPSGRDQGKGGKYLFTPPGFNGTVPQGYIHIPSPSYRLALAFRSIPAPGKSAADASEYAKKLRMYFLSEAANPPQQRFYDPINDRYPTLPYYDERAFEDLYEIVSVEPVREQDKVMMGMLTSLGIEKGKPFAPDETAKRAIRQAAIDAWFYLQSWWDHLPASDFYWPDRHYVSQLLPDANNRFTFIYDDRIDLIRRAAMYTEATFVPVPAENNKTVNAYLGAVADKNGRPLEAGKLYKVNVPPDMPVRQFWSLTIYDRATWAFIYTDTNRTTRSSYDLPDMKKNSDGSVTLYVGPKAPDGLEPNWIPTRGKRPMPVLRFYGVTDALNDKTFKMPDFEEV